jgi:hypothetical protein
MTHISSLGSIVALLIFSNAPAASQQMRDGAAAAMHTIRQPFAIETFGIFRDMMLSGDFSPKVQLSAAMEKHPTTGVGAIADARGEITIYDGKLIVSYGKPAAPVDVTVDHAALLAMGSAGQWQAVPIERDVTPEDVESYIAAAAKGAASILIARFRSRLAESSDLTSCTSMPRRSTVRMAWACRWRLRSSAAAIKSRLSSPVYTFRRI